MSLDDLERLIDTDGKLPVGKRPIVVVVDDDPSIRRSLQTVLRELYDVRVCKNAIEAIREISSDTDCVILDVKMPLHDGFWVAEQLRSRHEDVPIIFHSAYQNAKNPYEIINEFRPFGYVVKGNTLAALLELVANAVAFCQRIRERQRTLERLREARESMRTVQESMPERTTKGSVPPRK